MPNYFPFTAEQVHAAARRKGYAIFDGPKGGVDLNIIGIRMADARSNEFNDWLTFSYLRRGVWQFFALAATTDPGVSARQKPANTAGVAIVVPGQYRGVWTVGKHKGQYPALVQVKPIRVYRDRNRDAVLDTAGVPIQEGLFGINMHHAGEDSALVDAWSEGCQVVASAVQWDIAWRLVTEAVKTYGESFSYTLLTEQEVRS